MQKIPLTQGKFATVDDDVFNELSQYTWHARKSRNTFYAVRNVSKLGGGYTALPMHRQIIDVPSNMKIDHKFGDGLDNRRENLRICTNLQNIHNQYKRQGTLSKYKGVYKRLGYDRYRAQITVNGKKINLGDFSSAEIAARAYDRAARLYFGEFARPNFEQGIVDE